MTILTDNIHSGFDSNIFGAFAEIASIDFSENTLGAGPGYLGGFIRITGRLQNSEKCFCIEFTNLCFSIHNPVVDADSSYRAYLVGQYNKTTNCHPDLKSVDVIINFTDTNKLSVKATSSDDLTFRTDVYYNLSGECYVDT